MSKYEYTCPVCGKTRQASCKSRVKTYCSVKCRAIAQMEPTYWNRGACVYNPAGVACGYKDCTSCGWNPAVAEARLEAFLRGDVPNQEDESKREADKFGWWISCEERLPEDKVQVLVYTISGRFMALHCKDGRWCVNDKVVPTHWMPMPAKPEE